MEQVWGNVGVCRCASHTYNSHLTISKQFNSSLTGFYSEPQNQPFRHALQPPTLCSLLPSMEVSNHHDDIPKKLPGRLIPRLGPTPSTKSVIWVTLKLWYIHGVEKQAHRFSGWNEGQELLLPEYFTLPTWAARL